VRDEPPGKFVQSLRAPSRLENERSKACRGVGARQPMRLEFPGRSA